MKKFINKIKNNPKLYFLSILIVGVFFVLVVRITFAYLAPVINKAQSEVIGTSDTVDDFKFGLGNPIKIDATPTTLPENGTNYVSSTTATAYLKANSTNESATFNYFVYFQIETNTFKYSNGTTPEIILTVTDPNGNELTSLSGLTYGTFSGISGFDITTKNGIFDVATNYEITSESSKEYTNQTWTFTVTYLNLPIDQSSNFGNNMTINVHIRKEELAKPFHETCDDNTLACHVAKIYTGTQGENNIYYHESSLENGAGDNSYRYAGASDTTNNFVCFGTNTTPCPTDNLYRIIGVFGENYHGVSGQQLVKLIKYDYANSNLLGTDGDYYGSTTPDSSDYRGSLSTINTYYWNYKANTTINDGNGSNTWSTSLLNKTNLNTNYINNIGTSWSNKIQNIAWKVGDVGTLHNSSSEMYQNEIINTSKLNEMDINYSAKIGLMYASDLGFASSKKFWNDNALTMTERLTLNWLFMGVDEWTISAYKEGVIALDAYMPLGLYYGTLPISMSSVRPTFCLTQSTTYVSGSGTQSDPMIIN